MIEDDDLHAVAARPRTPLHPTITRDQIDVLVETFYADVWADARLGPIFTARIADRPRHLATMKSFWESVLLHTGSYRGRPMPAHMKLKEVVEGDFTIWLGHFERAVTRVFEPDARPLVIATAERIARSFWIGMFGGLSGRPTF